MLRSVYGWNTHRLVPTIGNTPQMLSIWLKCRIPLTIAQWPPRYRVRLFASLGFRIGLILCGERIFGMLHGVLVRNIRLWVIDRLVGFRVLSETVVDDSAIDKRDPET